MNYFFLWVTLADSMATEDLRRSLASRLAGPPSPDRRHFLQILLTSSLAVSAASLVGCSGLGKVAWRPPPYQECHPGESGRAESGRGRSGGGLGGSGRGL
jgi:hypothetical protein